jgi:hypothetical protein
MHQGTSPPPTTLPPTPAPTTTDTVSVVSTFEIVADSNPTSNDALSVKLALVESMGIDETSILDFSIEGIEIIDGVNSSSSSISGRRRRLSGYYWNIYYVMKISLSETTCCAGGVVDDLVVFVKEVCTSPQFDENVCMRVYGGLFCFLLTCLCVCVFFSF